MLLLYVVTERLPFFTRQIRIASVGRAPRGGGRALREKGLLALCAAFFLFFLIPGFLYIPDCWLSLFGNWILSPKKCVPCAFPILSSSRSQPSTLLHWSARPPSVSSPVYPRSRNHGVRHFRAVSLCSVF